MKNLTSLSREELLAEKALLEKRFREKNAGGRMTTLRHSDK